MLTCHIFVGLPTIRPKVKVVALEFYCSEKNAKACGYQRVCQET